MCRSSTGFRKDFSANRGVKIRSPRIFVDRSRISASMIELREKKTKGRPRRSGKCREGSMMVSSIEATAWESFIRVCTWNVSNTESVTFIASRTISIRSIRVIVEWRSRGCSSPSGYKDVRIRKKFVKGINRVALLHHFLSFYASLRLSLSFQDSNSFCSPHFELSNGHLTRVNARTGK